MAGLLPTVRGGRALALYPVVRTVDHLTAISQHLNLSEKRSKRRPPLTRIVLAYSSMTATETAAIRDFFDSQKGSFDPTWSLVLGRALIDGVLSGNTLSSATNSFTSLDVGKDVVIEGGGSGGDYVGSIVSQAGSTATVNNSGSWTATGAAPIRVGRFYQNMALEADTLPMVEQEPKLYNFSLSARQTQNAAAIAPAQGASYPNLAIGLNAQRPYTRIQRFAVLRNDNIFGMRYSWAWIGGGLSGFPANALHGWQLDYPVLSDADLATIENFFMGQWGRFGGFSFLDPDDSVTYSNVRFDSDSLEIHHEQIGVSSLSVKLLETSETA